MSVGKRRVNCGVQFLGPASTPPGLVLRHELQRQRRRIVLCGQGGHLRLLRLTNQLPMAADEAAHGGFAQDLRLVGLPGEEAGDGDEGQLLRQQARPFLEGARNNHAVVGWQDDVAREHVGR